MIGSCTLRKLTFYQLSHLKEENATLTAELREAREKIRNLELQLETHKANARKAAAALLDA